jgi:hypothetical protein
MPEIISEDREDLNDTIDDEIEFDEFAKAARVGTKMLLDLLMAHHGTARASDFAPRPQPAPAKKFSRTGRAVLAVVLGEIDRHGQCRLATAEIANRADCSERAVLLGMKDAIATDVLIVNRQSGLGGRSLPNLITRGPNGF